MTHHEQKPESAEFRTREAQRRHIAQSWADEGMSHALAYEWANRELREAEARGAAEQRRKDAEGAEAVQAPDEGPFLIVFQEDGVKPELFAGSGAKKGAYERFEMVSVGYHCRLYAVIASSMKHDCDNGALLRVSNVAALEARVKELEGELGALLDWADGQWCPHDNTHRGGSIWTICNDCGRKWADDVKPFDPDEDVEPSAIKQARAAIREGGEHG